MSAPDQPITMLVNVCREAVRDAERTAQKKAIASEHAPHWTTYLPTWHPNMVAVLQQFEDVK